MKRGGKVFDRVKEFIEGLALDYVVFGARFLANFADQGLSDALLLDLDSDHVTASIGITSNEQWVSVRSGDFSYCFDSFEAINIDCHVKRNGKRNAL